MSRLIIWRHGNTDWNAEGRVQGQTDVPLNELGRQQAVDAAELLVRLRPTAIVSSDLARAADTAAALAALTGLSVRADARLRERHFGPWQGLLMADVAVQRPAEYARWKTGADDIGDGIETLGDMGKRMVEAITDAAAPDHRGPDHRGPDPAGTVVVATHGASARQGILQLLGWPNELIRTFRALQNCHWVELTHVPDHGGWQLATYNVGPFAERPTPPPV